LRPYQYNSHVHIFVPCSMFYIFSMFHVHISRCCIVIVIDMIIVSFVKALLFGLFDLASGVTSAESIFWVLGAEKPVVKALKHL
jgi:hypothetical protein